MSRISKDKRPEPAPKSSEAGRTPAGVDPAGGAGGGGQYADDVQGEGNYEAAREYDDAQRAFVESGKVEQAARDAAPKSAEEERKLLDAEREGRSRRKSDE